MTTSTIMESPGAGQPIEGDLQLQAQRTRCCSKVTIVALTVLAAAVIAGATTCALHYSPEIYGSLFGVAGASLAFIAINSINCGSRREETVVEFENPNAVNPAGTEQQASVVDDGTEQQTPVVDDGTEQQTPVVDDGTEQQTPVVVEEPDANSTVTATPSENESSTSAEILPGNLDALYLLKSGIPLPFKDNHMDQWTLDRDKIQLTRSFETYVKIQTWDKDNNRWVPTSMTRAEWDAIVQQEATNSLSGRVKQFVNSSVAAVLNYMF